MQIHRANKISSTEAKMFGRKKTKKKTMRFALALQAFTSDLSFAIFDVFVLIRNLSSFFKKQKSYECGAT